MKKFDAVKIFLQDGCFVNLDNFSDLYIGHRELIICPIDSNGESLVFDSLFCISEYM